MQETTYSKADLGFLITKSTDSESMDQKPETMVEDSHSLSHAIIDNIKSVYITFEDNPDNPIHLNKGKLEFFIGELLWEGEDMHIMRCKGTFVDSETKKPYMLQGVEDLFEFREIE